MIGKYLIVYTALRLSRDVITLFTVSRWGYKGVSSVIRRVRGN